MQGDDREPVSAETEAPARIEATFRSGTLTAVGIIVGFSLGFLTRWAGVPGAWSNFDFAGLAAIVVGIAAQMTALVMLLSVNSLLLASYNRAVRVFTAGLILVAIGVILAVFVDIGGQGQRLLG